MTGKLGIIEHAVPKGRGALDCAAHTFSTDDPIAYEEHMTSPDFHHYLISGTVKCMHCGGEFGVTLADKVEYRHNLEGKGMHPKCRKAFIAETA